MSLPAHGQNRPKLLWQAELHGIHDLIVHGNKVELDSSSTMGVESISYRFLRGLPELEVPVTVEALDSRGYVHLLSQPTFANGYTLRIRIEDRQDGHYFYRLAIDWPDTAVATTSDVRSMGEHAKRQKPGRGEAWVLNGEAEKISCRRTWQGSVNGTAVFEVTNAGVKLRSGDATGDFLPQGVPAPLKEAKKPAVLSVSPEVKARILQAPNAENAYTLMFEIEGTSRLAIVEVAW